MNCWIFPNLKWTKALSGTTNTSCPFFDLKLKSMNVCNLFYNCSPVDNRPATNWLPNFVKKKKIKKIYIYIYISVFYWILTYDKLLMTCDMWHMARDRLGWWTFCKNVSSLAFMVLKWRCFEDFSQRGAQWLNLLITKLFVEQPRLHRVC